MLRLICSGTLNVSRYPRKTLVQNVKQNFRYFANVSKESTKQVVRQDGTKMWTMFGGVAVGLTIATRINRNQIKVQCEANRLVGLETKDKEIKFDWRRFWKYLKPHLVKLMAAIACSLAVAYYNIQIPNLLGSLVNALTKYTKGAGNPFDKSDFFHDIKGPAATLFSMYMIQSIFTFFYIHLLSQIGEQMGASIRQDLFRQMIIQDMEFFDKHRTGELVNRLTVDVQEFKHCFKQFVSQGLRSFAQLIGGTISLFMISSQLATMSLMAVPAGVLFGALIARSLRSLSKKSQVQTEKATAVCEEAISNIRTVRSSASEEYEMELFARETNKAADLAQELGLGIGVFQAMTNLFLNTMVLGTLSLGGLYMSNETITAGQLMAFLVSSQVVQRSLAQGSILLGTMIRGVTAGARVFEYLSVQPDVKLDTGVEVFLVGGKIVFQNIEFTYPARPNQKILKDFSLTLEPGQTVALVGESGSGKSTVAALLERFYEPTSGKIFLDGVDLSETKPDWLRKNVIGFIEQQPILFGTTIYENIRYACPNATQEEVEEAAKASQCHDFITNLPDGYETLVGERGVQLSGGQRQRIAIARALLKDPKILILDEATSALDANSEAVVQKALDDASKSRTSLVIAHRLSTIKNADLIVVLSHGKIVETGTHEELMKKKGAYFDLVKQQDKQEKSRAQG